MCFIHGKLTENISERSSNSKYLDWSSVNPTALRKAKIVCNFSLSECSRVKHYFSVKNKYSGVEAESDSGDSSSESEDEDAEVITVLSLLLRCV